MYKPVIQPDICCVSNVAPHYREAVFKLMDRELGCDFYIGDRIATPVATMNYEELKGFRRILNFVPLGSKFYWQKGASKLSFKSYEVYIIDGEPYCLSNWSLLVINRLLRKRSFLWSHGWYGDEGRVKKRIKKWFFNLADTVLLYGDYARNLMMGEGFDPGKLVSIYNSMDFPRQLDIFRTLKPSGIYRDHFNNAGPVLLYIGRIQQSKRLDLLVESIRRLNYQGDHCNLVIIGDEVETTNIRDLVSTSGLSDNVWFTGPLFEEERLGELIYNADVCVSPGNVGLTAIHCLTYGTPVITNDNFTNQGPEFEVIRENVTGAFFKENSVEDLCRKIKAWTSLSSENRESTRKQCQTIIAEHYTPQYQVNVLKNLIYKYSPPLRAYAKQLGRG